jgi:hypothetical protein
VDNFCHWIEIDGHELGFSQGAVDFMSDGQGSNVLL